MSNETIIAVLEAVDQILISTEHLPEQYHAKLSELGKAMIEVVAMAEGTGIKTIDVSDLPDGTHVINGVTVTKENGTVKLG